jgi:DNA polymerase-3 subunit epsilon
MDDYSLPKRFAFVDLETTGLDPKRDRVIEVGVLIVEDGQKIAEFDRLINPGLAEEDITTLDITGIDYADLVGAPQFSDLGEEILNLISSTLFIAHNAKFDYEFLREEFLELDIPFELPNLCSVKLSRELYPEFKHHDLSSLSSRFGIEISNRHRAFDDALAVWEFFKIVQSNFEPKRLNSVVSRLIEQPIRTATKSKTSKNQIGLI